MMFISNYLNDDLNARIEKMSEKELPDPYEAWKLS
jgi:hypothetical protein